MKRRAKSDTKKTLSAAKKSKANIDNETTKSQSEKCPQCRQYLKDVNFYNGHLNNSSEEFVALTDERLLLFTGEENEIHELDTSPSHKLTNFSVYDERGHLCPFDTGLVESDIILFMSGYIKPIYDEDPSPNNGIPSHDIGPINEWFISGFDGGLKAILGIVTPYAQYILMEPSYEYATFYESLSLKILLVKLVIEFLLEHSREDPNYEDLLFHIENSKHEKLTEDFLLQHAQFVCDQIYSFDQAGDEDDKPLITTPCIRTLVNLSGVKFRGKRVKCVQKETKTKQRIFSKATTTELVRSIFENFFPDQIEFRDKNAPKKKRCGVCEACQSPDCGKCAHCRDMVKFGGSGRGKQACKLRKCPNMAIEDAELSENEEEFEEVSETPQNKKISFMRSVNKVEWQEDAIQKVKGRKYYRSAKVGGIEVTCGDYVLLNPELPDEPLYIAKISYMFDEFPRGPMVHAQIFRRGSETILGETSDPREIFVVNICEDCPLGSVIRKAKVTFKEVAKDWFNIGGVHTELDNSCSEDDCESFFFNKQYDSNTGRFTDFILNECEVSKENIHFCYCCEVKSKEERLRSATLEKNVVKWLNETYKVGSYIFLDPAAFQFNLYHKTSSNLLSVDESIYPEYYRKTEDIKGSNDDTFDPFIIAQVEQILKKEKDIIITVRLFYRPENTKNSIFSISEKDLNFLYWTDELITCNFNKVMGKCYVKYCEQNEDPGEWTSKGPHRFYFKECYNPKTCEFYEAANDIKKVSCFGKGKGKKNSKLEHDFEMAPEWDKIVRPLRCMDVFAGCGGLSQGLHQSGIAETKWAIEKDVPAARAFKLNNKDCSVFTDDCNELLEMVISGQSKFRNLPNKGDVELLVGGPPCQGFSGMNRFNAGQYSLFKNSLVVSYLSYCDYYRPKYFILENVRNFVTFKRSMVLKLALRCLLAIGYQVTFGILQAGHYGVPQTRRRLILIAAAPGYKLPKLPEPMHVFNRRGCHLSFALEGVRYTNGNLWRESAPYRTICVRDAISDLPEITNGWSQTKMRYDCDPQSHFQRKMRRNDSDTVIDHICKQMAPIVDARISHIPENPGSDWRDLPNISVNLSDGTQTVKLRYPYLTKRQKKGEPKRGVCKCSTGGACDPADRQPNTLIPWCLPHTADRHNHWSGLYGRLEWGGFFGTTITNPEPMGKQGRVLHPEQNRVVSVRECARSQGFPDNFKFYGTVMDKHRQVGNAVPPPLGEAIGIEIKKVLALDQTKFSM